MAPTLVQRVCAAATAASMVFTACAGDRSPGGTSSAKVRPGPDGVPVDGLDPVVLVPVSLLPSAAIGKIGGELEVTHDGTASYRIPIEVPPGRNGVAPQLELVYDSSAGPGSPGHGWHLAGLHVVARCTRTVAVDGERDRPRFEPDDPLCLDGQRLVLIAGEAGHAGARYRPLIDGVVTIELLDDLDEEAPRMRLFTRQGDIITLGGADGNATVSATPPGHTGAVALMFLERRREDRAGNFQTVTYGRGAGAAVETWPEEIRYTGHPSLDDGRRTVRFIHVDRERPSRSFFAGIEWRQSKLLTAIETRAPVVGEDTLVRTYRLTHTVATATRRELLQAVTACDGAGVCLPPTTFGYAKGELAFDVIPTDITIDPRRFSVPTDHLVTVADVDGDRRDDLLVLDDGPDGNHAVVLRRALATPAVPFAAAVPSGLPPVARIADYGVGRSVVAAVDLDRQGGTEVLFQGLAGDLRPFRWSAAAGRYEPMPGHGTGCGGYRSFAMLGDFDGNGGTDVLGRCAATFTLQLQRGASYSTWDVPLTIDGLDIPDRLIPTPLDLDGDGRDELLFGDLADGTYRKLRWDPDGFHEESSDLEVALELHQVFLDANGDGLQDVLLLGHDQAPRIRWNTGAGFTPPAPALDDTATADYRDRTPKDVRVADLDGDGLDDFIMLFDEGALYDGDFPFRGNQMVVHRSDGERFDARVIGDPGTPNQTRVYPPVGPTPRRLGRYSESPMAWETTQLLDHDGDGLLDLIRYDDAHRRLELLRHRGEHADLLRSVVDGAGLVEIVSYAGPGSAVYADAGICHAPLSCQPRRRPLVQYHGVFSPSGVQDRRFTYAGARADLAGGGWLGFSRRTVQFIGRDDATTYEYAPDRAAAPGRLVVPEDHVGVRVYPLAFRPTRVVRRVVNADGRVHESEVQVTRSPAWFDGDRRVEVQDTQQRLEYRERASSGAIPDVLEHRTVGRAYDDEHGTLILHSTRSSAGFVRTVTIEPEHRAEAHLVGLPRVVRTELVHDGEIRVVETHNTFDARGDLETSVREPDEPALQLAETIVRDGFGLPERFERRTADGRTRSVELDYDEGEHQFAIASTNSAGHVTRWVFDPRFGAPLAHIDPNGAVASVRLDGFGRVVRSRAPGGGESTSQLEVRDDGALGYQVRERQPDGAERVMVHDPQGRLVEERVLGFDLGWDRRRFRYDARGRLTFASQLVDVGVVDPPGTTTKFDALDRPIAITQPDGSSVEFAYRGLQEEITNPRGFTRTLTRDFDGNVLAADGPGTDDVTFAYDATGALAWVKDGVGNAWTMANDDLGRRVRTEDPDLGVVEEHHDAFGELAWVRHADRETRYDRDDLGRVKRVVTTTPDLGTVESLTEWDTQPYGIGRVAFHTSPDGVRVDHHYDELGRLATRTTRVDGESFAFDYGYDGEGRLAKVQYPILPGRARRLAVEHRYQRGVLASVLADGAALWTLDASGHDGQPRLERFGNGVRARREFDRHDHRLRRIALTTGGADGAATTLVDTSYLHDSNGNLHSRTDNLEGSWEQYGYDELDRLITVTPSKKAPWAYGYDDVGNLISRPGVELRYGLGGRPHVLDEVVCAPCPPTLQAGEVVHDALGRRRVASDGTRFTYTDFDLPARIERPDGLTVELAYDAEHQRVVRRAGAEVTITVGGGAYTRHHGAHGRVHTAAIPGPDGPVAAIVVDESTGVETTTYLHGDHQGSLIAVTGADGGVRARFWNDPFGASSASEEVDGVAQRFAGHEVDAALGLVDMGGRVYDPATARFLSPDPLNSRPMSAQGWNRYSYVLNNPLSLVDPSGFQVDTSPEGSAGGSSGGGGDPGEPPDATISFFEELAGASRGRSEAPVAISGEYVCTGQFSCRSIDELTRGPEIMITPRGPTRPDSRGDTFASLSAGFFDEWSDPRWMLPAIGFALGGPLGAGIGLGLSLGLYYYDVDLSAGRYLRGAFGAGALVDEESVDYRMGRMWGGYATVFFDHLGLPHHAATTLTLRLPTRSLSRSPSRLMHLFNSTEGALRWQSAIQYHHVFPQQLAEYFLHLQDGAIYIHDFTVPIPAGEHSILHADQWNALWLEWFEEYFATHGRAPRIRDVFRQLWSMADDADLSLDEMTHYPGVSRPASVPREGFVRIPPRPRRH